VSRLELMQRLGRYPSQLPPLPHESEEEETRREHLETDGTEGVFPIGNAEDILDQPASSDPAEQWLNSVVAARNEQAEATVANARRTPEERLAREIALALEARTRELEAEQAELGPELAAQYEADPEETAALETWLETPGHDDDLEEEPLYYDDNSDVWEDEAE
jgi:hypothetical protein